MNPVEPEPPKVEAAAGDVRQSNAPGPEAAPGALVPSLNNEQTGEKQGSAQPAAGNNTAAYLIACCACCCACCCCVFIIIPALLLGFVESEARVHLSKLLAPEEYEYAGWATVSDVPECSSVVRDVFASDASIGDAAVSALLCMAVAAPHLMGLGGGFLALYYDEKRDKVEALNALGISPADVANVDDNAVYRGPKASIVPGAVRGYEELHKKLNGTMKWKQLFTPAIKLAKEGFAIKKNFAKVLAKHETELSNSDIKPIFNGVKKEGDKLVQPDLAKLLEDLSKKGADHFYNEVSKEIINNLGTDAMLTEDDFKKYRPAWSAPVTRDLRDYTLYAPPFPSSGVLLLQVIPEEVVKLSDMLRQSDDMTPELTGDSTSLKEQLSSVLAKLPDLDGDAPDKGFPQLVKDIRDSLQTKVTAKKSKHTIVQDYGGVHLSIIKGYEAVTIISSINEPFGSKKASVPGLIMNNYMSAFAATPDVPNGRKGGKQPRTSMVPVFVKQHEQRVLRLQAGAGGGIPGMWALAQVLSCIPERNVSFCIRSVNRILPTLPVSPHKDRDIQATASGIFIKRPLVSWLAPPDDVHCDGASDGEKTTAAKKMKATETKDYCERTKDCEVLRQLLVEVILDRQK